MKISKYPILFLAITLLCSACQRQPLFEKNYNQKRIELGIPIIPEDWKASSVGADDATWWNPNLKTLDASQIPFHRSKYVYYPSGVLDSEQDTYFGRNDFPYDGSMVREEIFIDCKYSSQSGNDTSLIQKGNCEATYNSNGKILQHISLSQAKEILDSWGLSFP